MKRPQLYLTSGTLVVAAAFAGGGLTSAIFSTAGASGAETRDVPAAAGGLVQEAPAAAAAATDSCALLSEAQASAALGSPVTQMPSPGQCTYVATDGSARGVAVALPGLAANRNQLKAGADQTAAALEGSVRSIAAGDESYAVLSPMVSQGLGYDDGSFVIVALTNPTGTADQQASQINGLLQTAFGRL
jgi:hypothetical protein